MPVTHIDPFDIYWPVLMLFLEGNLYVEKSQRAKKYFQNNFRLNYIENNLYRNEV